MHALFTDRAASRANLASKAEKTLRCEVAQNAIFPLAIPGVNTAR